jgi:hypothetical protein
MLDALKTLFENDVVSEEVRTEIQEAWEAKVTENRQQVTAELREEFAKKYEHDKSVMVESIDKMLEERLAEEIAEFSEDRKQLAEAKAKYAVAMRENADLMKRFVVDSLSKEVSELHSDQKMVAENFEKLQEFIVEALAKEIAEFHADKQDLAETKVRLVREAKSHLEKVKKDFISKSASLISETVDKTLKGEIGQLKEDIDEARKNDFGRKLFEAFASEYSTSYLNENSETAKLMKVVELKDKQLAEAKVLNAKAIKLAEDKQKEVSRVLESAQRKDTLNDLLGPLSKDQKEIMTDLLESVQTPKLQAAFDKYLPSVINGSKGSPAKQKAVLSEGKEVTGNRENTNSSKADASDNNVVDIKRLAGLN